MRESVQWARSLHLHLMKRNTRRSYRVYIAVAVVDKNFQVPVLHCYSINCRKLKGGVWPNIELNYQIRERMVELPEDKAALLFLTQPDLFSLREEIKSEWKNHGNIPPGFQLLDEDFKGPYVE